MLEKKQANKEERKEQTINLNNILPGGGKITYKINKVIRFK